MLCFLFLNIAYPEGYKTNRNLHMVKLRLAQVMERLEALNIEQRLREHYFYSKYHKVELLLIFYLIL